MILFGLSGGIGNCLFCLPSIKALSKLDQVSLVVDADYDCEELFRRCKYVHKVYDSKSNLPKASRYVCGQYVPRSFRGKPVEFCGWPRGTSTYTKPEWAQIKGKVCGNEDKIDVSDWIQSKTNEPNNKDIDFALIPCGKPGDEWSRKKWNRFHSLALVLESRGYAVRSFGQREEIGEAGLQGWWHGHRNLQDLPEALRRCRVAVSTDSGIGHLASSLGIPTVMLFTATSTVKGQPLGEHKIISKKLACSPCQSTQRWKECADWRCRAISVDEVVEAATSFLF